VCQKAGDDKNRHLEKFGGFFLGWHQDFFSFHESISNLYNIIKRKKSKGKHIAKPNQP
jgi:hypothetical protein